MPNQRVIATGQVRDPELRRFQWQVGLLIAVTGLGLIAWMLTRRGEQNDDSNSIVNFEPRHQRQTEDDPLRDAATNTAGPARDRGKQGPFFLFGPDLDSSLSTPEVPRYQRLEEALHHALDGSTIEITGRGPFIVEPMHLEGRSLRIVAAANSQPLLVLTDAAVDLRRPMFETDASLVLEGLELRSAQFHQASNPQNTQPLIVARGPELRLSRCRLRAGLNAPQPLIRAEVLDCRLIDCEIYTGRGVGIEWHVVPSGKLVCQNDLFSGWSAIQVECPTPPPPDTNLELTHNTCVNQLPLQIHFTADQPEADTQATASVLSVAAESNLFDARQSVLGVMWRNDSLPRGTFAALSRTMRWTKDRDNVYAVSDAWISQHLDFGPWSPLADTPRTAESWAASWDISTTFASHASAINFARAGLSQLDFLKATNLTAEDFRPHPATNVGADLDHIGPKSGGAVAK